ncbi:MAG: tRNA-intron lyase [Thermoproteota archaeon]|nr:tRNA-intron lyase [Thermoproteota archaeon]
MAVASLKQMRQETNAEQEAERKIPTFFTEEGVVISSSEDIEELSSRGYGTLENEKLVLKLYETLFLLGKKVIEVEDEKTGKPLDFQNLLQTFQSVEENAWVSYLIYRDLRSRGYVVREGFGLGTDFRVYERGGYGEKTAKYLIFGVYEGNPVPLKRLARALKYVQSLKKKLVLAVVNRRGEVVYYSLSQLTLK